MSGKEARNKLIQLLYLTLTALVAMLILHINPSEQLKIYQELKENCNSLYEKHTAKYNIIKSQLAKKNDNNKKIYKKIIDLFDIEKSTVDTITLLEEKLISSSGGDKQDVFSKNLNKTNIVKTIMITEHGSEKLEDSLNMFKNKLNDLGLGDNFSSKNFKINFDDTPLITALLYLSQNKEKIIITTDIMYSKLLDTITVEEYIFDKYELIIIPKNDIIFAGKYYEADVFLNVKIPTTTPEITVDGNKINVDNNIGKIKIKTSKKMNFDKDGRCQQSITVKFKQKNPENNKTIELNKKVSFVIVNKQNIECKNNFSERLYKFCANKYTILNNDPDDESKISFRVDYGEVKELSRTSSQYSLLIYPTHETCTLDVLNDGMIVFKKTFTVSEAPLPKIEVIINDKIYSENSAFKTEDLREVGIHITPDEEFSTTHPDENSYKVNRWDILFCKHKKIISSVSIEDESSYNLRKNKDLLSSCDKIIIQIKQIKRINYKQEKINIFKDGEIITRSYIIVNNEED
ncbi:MAG: hypothetical protein II393_03280 [Cytophagales bacterium]|nr:hypothetical protein [Cytophagales bacterium]